MQTVLSFFLVIASMLLFCVLSTISTHRSPINFRLENFNLCAHTTAIWDFNCRLWRCTQKKHSKSPLGTMCFHVSAERKSGKYIENCDFFMCRYSFFSAATNVRHIFCRSPTVECSNCHDDSLCRFQIKIFPSLARHLHTPSLIAIITHETSQQVNNIFNFSHSSFMSAWMVRA